MAGYEQSVAPGDTAPLPNAPTNLGQDVVASEMQLAQQIGDQHARMRQLMREQQQDTQSVDWANRFATMQGDLAQSVTDLRAAAPADGSGHVQQVLQDYDTRAAAALDGISDPRVRRTAQLQVASMRGGLAEREATFAAGARVQHLKTGAETAIATLANHARGLDSPLDWHALEGQSDAMIDNLAGVDATAKETMKRGSAQAIYGSALQGLIDRDPTRARAVLDHGALDDVLEPHQVEQLGNAADAGIRRVAAEQHAQLALGKSQVEQSISLVNSQLGDGVVIPDAQLAQAQAMATQYGLTDKAYNLGVARERQSVNLETQSWKPGQYQDEMNRLAAKGTDATPAEQVRLDQLRKIAPKRTEDFNTNPGGYAAANGAPPPAIDPDSGDGFAARSQWRQGVQRSTGVWTPTLAKDEAQPWIDKVQHGTAAERLAAAQWISQWGGEAPNVLRQIEPNRDSAFAQAVWLGTVSPGAMRDALAGPDALKALGGEERAFKVNTSLGEKPPAQIFGEDAGRALQARGPAFASAAYDNAQALYASLAQRNGWTMFHPGAFQISLRRALGGRQQASGEWTGGLGTANGTGFVLPTSMTQRDYDRTIARADAAHLVAAAGNADAVYADGKTVSGTALKAMIPVSVGDGRYAFRAPGSNVYVQAKHGGPWVLDVTKLPR